MRFIIALIALTGVLASPSVQAQEWFSQFVHIDNATFPQVDPNLSIYNYHEDVGSKLSSTDKGLSLRIYSAYENTDDDLKLTIDRHAIHKALQLDQNGLTAKRSLTVDEPPASGRAMYIQHTTDQTFGIRSHSASQGLQNGGIGFTTDSAYYPFWVFDTAESETMSLNENGVGVGTYTPDATVHVYADGSPLDEAKILVENNNTTTAARDMFELVNNGGSRFTFTDTSINSRWEFSSNGSGAFSISRAGTGGSEMRIMPNGRVVMGPGGRPNLDLRANGDLIIAGTLVQSSDRNRKKNFKEVSDRQVLEKLSSMPVYTWQFDNEEADVRHMGPTAQDFRAAFELGYDEKTMAPVDGIGVSLAAIKALKQDVEARDDQIDDLKTQLAGVQLQLEKREEQLDQQHLQLESVIRRLNRLEHNSK